MPIQRGFHTDEPLCIEHAWFVTATAGFEIDFVLGDKIG